MNDQSIPSLDNDPFAVPKPDWAAWGKQSHAPLWAAAAIACNIDPGYFRIHGQPMTIGFRTYPAAMVGLLNMAKASIGASGVLRQVQMNGADLDECEISLANFATWLNSISYPVPEGFPWAQEATDFVNLNWPWGRHSTKLLRLLAEAADRFWKHYDPNDATTAPTNEEVANWLQERNVSKRTAEVMASLLRADGLPVGPRK